VIKMLMSFFRF